MYLKLDTQFNPFTYDELVKPLVDYGKAYKEVEEAYSTLAEQANAFESIASRDTNSEAYTNYYQPYSDQLNDAIDDFSKGMTGANRAKLLGLKRDYAKYITPIAKAEEAMKAANALRDQVGPDGIFQVERYNSLDDFLHGEVANNGRISESAYYKETADLFRQAMQTYLQDPEFADVAKDMKLMMTQHNGVGYDMLSGIMEGKHYTGKLGELAEKIYKDVSEIQKDKVGYDKFDTTGKTRLENTIKDAAFAMLDNPNRTITDNPKYWSKKDRMAYSLAQDELALKAAEYAHKLDKDKNNPRVPTYSRITRVIDGGRNATYLDSGTAAKTVKGTDIKVTTSEGKYVLKADGDTLATIDANGNIDVLLENIGDERFKEIFGCSYTSEYDDPNMKSLAESILNIVNREGEKGILNYEYKFEPDNYEFTNDDGAYVIVPLKRDYPTTANSSTSSDSNVFGTQN